MDNSSILSVIIAGFNEKYTGSKIVTFYELKVRDNTNGNIWTLEKRFNDFKGLYNSLKLYDPDVPDIPSSTLFKVTSPEALEKRKEALQMFLNACIREKHILLTKEFLEFLDVERNTNNIRINEPELFYQYSKLPLGVRDFKIYEKKGVLFVCCSDMNIVSRADSRISNFNFFGSDKNRNTSGLLPLGAFFVYQFEKNFKNPNERFIIHKIWAKTFSVETGCVFIDEDTEIFGVGLDDGKIDVFRDKKDTHFVKSEMVLEICNHTARVTGIAHDNKRRCFYSCSNDHTCYATFIKDYSVEPLKIKEGQYEFTALYFDQKSCRLILANQLGEVSVFLTNKEIITEAANVQTSPLTCIRALNISLYHNYIFSGTVNGKITVTNLGPPGKEKFMSEISTFGSCEIKIRVCCFWLKNFELICGDESGRISIWNLHKGNCIKFWIAHTMAITKMHFDEDRLLLYTGSKDKFIRMWKLPERWNSESCDDSKILPSISEYNKIVTEKLEQNEEEDFDSNESESDSLNGWNFRNN